MCVRARVCQSLEAVEQALDMRETKLVESWRLLQERGVMVASAQGGEDHPTRHNHIMALLLEVTFPSS